MNRDTITAITMAVDEFGREIPAARSRGGRDRSLSPGYGSPSRDGDGGGGDDGAGAPQELYQELSSSRYGRDPRDTSRGRDNNRGGGDRGPHHHSARKRKHRSESPNLRGDRRPKGPHPSTLYAEEPMLCQYLWKEANPGKEDEDYDEYRRSYGLNYVRTFFNEHMDDSWFRSLYSPLGKYNYALQERERSSKEASEFKSELEASLSDASERDGRCYFVLKARLGGGVRQPRKLPGDDYNSPKSRQSSSSSPNPVPATHLLSSTGLVLPILDIPAHVTDEQLTTALMNHSKQDNKTTSVVLYSSPPRPDLSRTAYLFAPDEVRKDIITQLNNLERGATASTPADGAHVPRKDETFIPKTLELEVDCSDAYGRTEVDSDGKGGAPEDGAVPSRKASVWVSTVPLTPNVQVLSAAVSSKERIAEDQEAALRLATAYDLRRGIPEDCNLETILSKAVPALGTENSNLEDIEDALDVSVAYLRRVHLFTFYNGCTASSNIAEVFSGKHPTSTIHLRLANADEILKEIAEKDAARAPAPDTSATTSAADTESNDEPAADADAPAPAEEPSKQLDLLVQRLNGCIEKALNECTKWDESDEGNGDYVVSKEIDTQAREIQHQESLVEGGWMDDHTLVDEDGRARCSFHFCRKLFKDQSFLRKHLMKKHSEFLRAEVAKCHDAFMMEAWDKQERRPVPPILVECGRAFSTVPSPVLGAAEPKAEDPEPELWRKQEERRKQEEEELEARRERYQQHHSHQHHRHYNDGGDDRAPDLDSALPDGRPPPPNERRGGRGGGFVDVDEMKVEKVEMSFGDIPIPVPTADGEPVKKKKKKKRKLL